MKIGNSSAQHNKDVLLGKSQFLLLGKLPLGNWPPWEIAPWELASLGNCTLGTSLLGNWPPWEVALGKYPLGKCTLGSGPWEKT